MRLIHIHESIVTLLNFQEASWHCGRNGCQHGVRSFRPPSPVHAAHVWRHPAATAGTCCVQRHQWGSRGVLACGTQDRKGSSIFTDILIFQLKLLNAVLYLFFEAIASVREARSRENQRVEGEVFQPISEEGGSRDVISIARWNRKFDGEGVRAGAWSQCPHLRGEMMNSV